MKTTPPSLQLQWLYRCTKLSYREIAAGVGVSHTAVARWMVGDKHPTKRNQARLDDFIRTIAGEKKYLKSFDTFRKEYYASINDPVYGRK